MALSSTSVWAGEQLASAVTRTHSQRWLNIAEESCVQIFTCLRGSQSAIAARLLRFKSPLPPI